MACVYVMIGISGSGKSTYANILASQLKNINENIVLSSDEIRGELFGDETNQNNNGAVFNTLYARMREALEENKDVIVDATNVSFKARKKIFNNAKDYDCEFVAYYINTKLENALWRNEHRDRKVPKEVIIKQYNGMCKPQKSEGFDRIYYVKA